MCGIVGILRFDGKAVEDSDLRPLNESIIHRGPDDDGFFTDGPVGLAMRRLSIIDLTNGHQPQTSADGGLIIVFNGEIYNYRALRSELSMLGYPFQTHSDTEVILAGFHHWGTGVFSRLEGMWGLALWERATRRLYLSRDRLGKKQIYYGRVANALVFGSEMSVPMAFSPDLRRLDYGAVAEFLTYSYVTGPGTALSRVSSLPEGHWATVDCDGRMDIRPFWAMETVPRADAPVGLAASADACWELLVKAVEKRLVSDVPITLMLSSGLDSSAIAWIVARELNAPLRSYTVGYDDADFDESADAGVLARRLGLDWQRIPLDGGVVRDAFPHFIRHASSLQANTAQMVYYFVCKAIHADGFKVAMNGSGGDELFAGYKTYRADAIFSYFRHLPTGARHGLHRAARLLPASLGRVSLDYQLKKFTECPYMDIAKAHSYWRTIFSPMELKELLVPEVHSSMAAFTRPYDAAFAQLGATADPVINNLLASDLKAWLGPMLPWADNISMAHSVEIRLPFLDHDLVQAALTLPSATLFKGWELKRIMKAFLKDRLPDDVVFRRKAGTHLPISRWLDNELAGVRDHGLSVLRKSGLVRPEVMDRFVEDHRNRRMDNTFKIWNLMVLGAWIDEFSISC
ncbi:asparagine synthase (glutamine-hydrolyzing) [Paramagnetospirillum kuznetsovii]|uniref:asparagine synthase (glutamine-hydrolyzing) n=1 Tax=Paramagnetospirillum kuznetsovii TaxID=2053833 RepID=A0A364NXX9_9PROT|nr:asparagine synthase (glutamine-hydrolyzing) [Paramagnetospirillum kuznetsovii]RAU21850.1 asparagine synthase (glutamine-hydrolyzing) [Paramagnetospirillum kuznetsovii]